MQDQSYVLCRETLGIFSGQGKPSMVTLPSGSIITIIGPASQETGLVEARWNEQVVRVFAVDVEERGEPVRD